MPQPLRAKPKLLGGRTSRGTKGCDHFAASNQMRYSGAKDLRPRMSQCFVCEKPIVGDHWVAQVKLESWTIRLCCLECSKLFYAQRLGGLRRVAFLAALRSLAWPSKSYATSAPTKIAVQLASRQEHSYGRPDSVS